MVFAVTFEAAITNSGASSGPVQSLTITRNPVFRFPHVAILPPFFRFCRLAVRFPRLVIGFFRGRIHISNNQNILTSYAATSPDKSTRLLCRDRKNKIAVNAGRN